MSSSETHCECACTNEKDSGILNVCCNSPKTMQMSAWLNGCHSRLGTTYVDFYISSKRENSG